MKKAIILVALFLAFTAGYAQDKKVAVVTFYINKQVDVSSFGGEAQLASIKLRDEPNFNLQPILQEFHSRFFEEYSKDFPFQLLPEDQILNNDAYKAFSPIGTEATSGPLKGLSAEMFNLPFPGYKIVLPVVGHENERNLLAIFPQADGVMKVYIDFSLVKWGFGGMGIVKMNAHANVALFNKNGDKVFSIKEDAESKTTGALVAGIPVMTPETILPMCESAMDKLLINLQKDLPKMVRKTEAKL